MAMYDSDTESEFGASRRYQGSGQKAVVISITKDYWILAQEKSDESKEVLYRMSRQSFNVNRQARFPRMRETVIIHEAGEQMDCDAPSSVPRMFVRKFQYTSQEEGYIKQEVMAVAEIHKNYITLVGKTFGTQVHACVPFNTDRFSVGQLVIGELRHLPLFVDYFIPKVDDDIIYFKTNFKVQRAVEKRQMECPNALVYPENIRPLTTEEQEKIFTRCANLQSLNLSDAQRYIQEPLIAAGLLEKYTQHQEVLMFLVSVRHCNLGVNEHGVPHLSFYIKESQYHFLFGTQSLSTWRVGGEVQIVHKQLKLKGREKEAHMIIRRAQACNSSYRIYLYSTERSRDLLKAAFNYPRDFEEDMFHISPIFDNKDATVDAVRYNFDDFFLKRRALFDLCTGRVDKPVDAEIPDKDKPFLVNGKPLDASQLDFMRSAAAIRGFTCAQAPPGCGKTHTTSALVSLLKEMNVQGGICISGTTNAAVTNAADAVASRFPDIRIVREYSVKAVTGITAASQRASLKHMSANAEKYVDLDAHAMLNGELVKMNQAKKLLDKKAANLRQHLSRVQNTVKLEMNVQKSFVQAYDVQVYATTVELLIRRGDIFRDSNDEDNKSVRRLILDEAALMSPVEAMALYCTFPHLEYITLLGDMKQLGPHSSLPKGSMCFTLITEGELTRMYKLQSTTKKDLNTIYRCHPAITEKFLIPIYGSQMKSGISAASRSLAKDHKLPVADDGSPALLIDVPGQESKGQNRMEMNTALDLIHELVNERGVPAEDVVVICNHRAQLNSLNQELRDQGPFGPLKTKVAVHTVDSFQGKEAKVVILLTTKSCSGNESAEHKMQFVGDAARGTVAVSRAQHALYILGHWKSLAQTEFWKQFLKNMIVTGGIVDRNLEPSKEVIRELRIQMKFSINETVEKVKVEVIEPQEVAVAADEVPDLISFSDISITTTSNYESPENISPKNDFSSGNLIDFDCEVAAVTGCVENTLPSGYVDLLM